jgi:hypothetical protein
MVTFGLDQEIKVDLDSVRIDMPISDYGNPSTTSGMESPPPESEVAAEQATNKAIMDSMKEPAK